MGLMYVLPSTLRYASVSLAMCCCSKMGRLVRWPVFGVKAEEFGDTLTAADRRLAGARRCKVAM